MSSGHADSHLGLKESFVRSIFLTSRAVTELDLYLGLLPELFPVDPLHLDFRVRFLVGGALWEERKQKSRKFNLISLET